MYASIQLINPTVGDRLYNTFGNVYKLIQQFAASVANIMERVMMEQSVRKSVNDLGKRRRNFPSKLFKLFSDSKAFAESSRYGCSLALVL